MKNTFITFFLIISSVYAPAQMSRVNSIINSKIDLIKKLNYEQSDNIVYLRTPFAGAAITNPNAYVKVRGKVIVKIELVFTTYKRTMNFQQKELNKKRLYYLYKIDPSVLKNDMIQWKVIGQTECNSPEDAENYFHGFKITFQPPVTVEKELEHVVNVLTGKNPKDRDTTIAKILNRNTHWDKMLIVADFTSSMYPYSAEVLYWFQQKLKTNTNRIAYFTFFNDGDTRAPSKKPIGSTGGIYHCKTNDFEKVKNLAYTTMQNGVGGKDIEENNIEALLKGIDRSPDCKDVIMMADNYATPKDLVLLKDVTKPIKIILCGYNGIVNTNYLDIARHTKGSVHIANRDILNLHQLREGQSIKIDGQIYKIVKGKFRLVY